MPARDADAPAASLSAPPLVRRATMDDLPVINRIYNYEVEHGVATWDLAPWSLEQRAQWFAEHDDSTPVLVAELAGALAGFGYLAPHSPRAGYRFTREDAGYVNERFQRRGAGRALLAALIEEARSLGMHTMLAGIESENAASVALHRSFGFVEVGRQRQTGHKFDRWLDRIDMQLLLDQRTT
ncbi:MAG: GNAT family N-acetyltransferase [Dehalococcoidia bacterium]|nr:GNAT family N-acetyltransferase [Dehalococcoidia bacterium]